MDQDTGHGLIGNLEGFCLSVLHLKVVGGAVQLEAICCLDLHRIIGTVFQGNEDSTVFVRGDGIDQFIVYLTDLECGAGNALGLISFVDLDNLNPADGIVIKSQGLRICRVYHHGLGLRGRINGVAINGFRFLNHNRAGHTTDSNLAVGICGIKALAGQVAVVSVHIATIGIGQLKLHTSQRLFSHGIELSNDQSALRRIIEAQGLYLTGLNLNGLGRSVQHIALHCFDLSGGHRGAGLQIINNNAAILIGNVLSIAGANDRAGTICDQERHARQRRCGTLDILFDDQCGTGRVGEVESLRIIGVDLDGLGLLCGINAVSRNGCGFGHYQGAHYTVNLDFSIFIGKVKTVAGDVAVLVRHVLTGRCGHLKCDSLERFASERVPLVDDKGTGFGIGHDHRLGIPVGANYHIGGGLVYDVSLGRLNFGQYIGAGGQVGDTNLPRRVGGKDAVLSQCAVTDHTIQADLTSSGRRYSELSTSQGLPSGTVPLLDNDGTLGLVLEGKRNGSPLLDLDGLGLGVNQETSRSLCFSDDHALAGSQALDADLAVFVRAVDSIIVPDQSAIRIHDLKLGILKSHTGIDRTNLTNQQISIRHILKPDGDNRLFSAVGQIDGFRRLDNAVAVRRVHFLQNIGARFEAGPNSGAIFAGHLLANNRSTGARCPAKVTQLERAARKGLTSDAVVFLDDDGVKGSILEGNGFLFSAMENDLLSCGLYHLEPRSRLYLSDGVFAGIQPLSLLVESDLAVRIRQELAKINGGRCVSGLAIAGIGYMESRSLHGGTSNAILLVDGEFRAFAVFEYKFFVIPCIQRDRLYPICILVRQEVGGRYGQFSDTISARGHTEGNCTILTGGNIMLIVTVNGFNPEDSAGNRGSRVRSIYFGNGELRLLQVVKDQLLLIPRTQPDRLSRFRCHHIGVRHRNFSYLITVYGKASQSGCAIFTGSNIRMVTVMDALYLENSTWNNISCLAITLKDRQGRKFFINCGNRNRAAAIHIFLIHMNDNRFLKARIRSWHIDFNESIKTFGDVGNGNNSSSIGFLCGNDLPIFQNIEYCAFDGLVGVVYFQKFEFYFRVIFEHKVNVALAVPIELLPYLVRIFADRIPIRRGDFSGYIRADGYRIPGHILQISTNAGGISAGKAVINTLDLNYSTSQPLGGIIRVNFTNGTLSGDDRSISKGNRDGGTALVGQNNILRPRIIDFVALRRIQFSYGISACIQRRQRISAITSGDNLFGIGTIGRLDQEPSAGQSLVGIRRINLPNCQFILLSGDSQLANHDRLDIIGRMIIRAGTCVGIFINCAISPNSLFT